MSNNPPNPVLRSAGPEDVDDMIADFPVWEVSMLSEFFSAITNGIMPDGSITTLTLVPEADIRHFSTDYKDWASEPWKSMKMPDGPFGMPMTGPSPAPVIRITHALSGLDVLMERAMNMNLKEGDVEISFKSVKSLLWNGISPMSEAQWQAKELDKRENIEEAMAIIQQVVDVFRYLRKPEIQGQLRSTHNKIFAEINTFQKACDGLRASKGEPKPEFNMISIWEEFMRIHWEFMEIQARAWVFKRLAVVYATFKTHFVIYMTAESRQVNSTQATMRLNNFDILIMNRLLDMYFDADISIHRPIEGFISTAGVQQEFYDALMAQAPEAELTRIYAKLETGKVQMVTKVLKDVVAARASDRLRIMPAGSGRFPEFLNASADMTDREFGHKSLQPEIENPRQLRMEPWIAALTRERPAKFGYVVYRLSYGESDEAWAAFLERFKNGLDSGWEGVVGAAAIRDRETLHWIDGKSEKIPEGDVGAARAHFQNFSKNPFFPPGLSKTACLGITSNSVMSFDDTHANDRKGDFRGFLHVMDPAFDSTKTPATGKHDYNGSFKIVDQLVWTDLYARSTVTRTKDFKSYWDLSTKHPWGVYVGPSTSVGRRAWRELRGGAIVGLWSFLKKGASRGTA